MAKKTCMFCGMAATMSAEHVFPDWSRPYLTSPYGQGKQERTTLFADGSKTSHVHQGDPATTIVRTVCGPCNILRGYRDLIGAGQLDRVSYVTDRRDVAALVRSEGQAALLGQALAIGPLDRIIARTREIAAEQRQPSE